MLVTLILTSFAYFWREKDFTVANGKYVPQNTNCSYGLNYAWNFNYNGTDGSDGSVQDFPVPCSGTYYIEAWGAQGGLWHETDETSYGGYTAGYITLEDTETLYVFVGGHPTLGVAGYNGGGLCTGTEYYSGGGASDIRLYKNEDGDWDDFDSLKSRIMVAGAGGGAARRSSVLIPGGYGGGLIGGTGSASGSVSDSFYAKGGTQFDGGAGGQGNYARGTKGQFGKGGVGDYFLAGGGSGYFGGGSYGVNTTTAGSGAGGSSFVSGHEGCNAIPSDYASPTDAITVTGTDHYSNRVFTSPVIIDGEGYLWEDERKGYVGQTEPDGTTVVGHSGHGFVRITFISD